MIELSNKKEGGALGFILRLALFSFLISSTAALFSAAGAYLYFARLIPDIPPFDSIKFGKSSTITTALGETIGEIYEERRYLLPYDRIPRTIINAFLSSEDARFFEHTGIDLTGIGRAIWTNIRAGGIKEGGSTITQQLARSMFTGREKTVARKIKEAITARRIEDTYTKEQILLLYMNLIYLGHGSYGVQAAALNYFRKDVSQLTLSEAAIIAALPQSPSLVNPVKDIKGTKEKRDRILKRMFEGGHILKSDYENALSEEIKAFPLRDTFGDKTPYFTEWAKEQLKEKTGEIGGDALNAAEILKKAGFSCETTIDLGLSLEAEDALMEGLKSLDKKQGFRGAIKQISPADIDSILKKGKEAY
ncbi:MAG: transglycosylase domain-containing protein, partial [Deltaproteobacteria bacterium]|nr:transglycosylase domain-containing protein [Deltaproteobacteria bacterium]